MIKRIFLSFIFAIACMTSSNACDIPAGYYLPANSTCSTSYTQLDYIESSGTQYINTGVSVRNIYKLEITFASDTVTVSSGIAGGRTSGTGGVLVGFSGTNFIMDWGERYTFGAILSVNTPYKVVAENKTATVYNESTNAQVATHTYTTKSTENAWFYLFGYLNTDGNPSYAKNHLKIYNVKIYTDANTLAHNYIPVKNSSNVLGMYDTVTNTFLTNAGTGDFTAGTTQGNIAVSNYAPCPANSVCPGVTGATENAAVVQGIATCNIPAGQCLPANTSCPQYTKLEYLESNGMQYINTGVAAKDVYGYEISFIKVNSTVGYLFGARDGNNPVAQGLLLNPITANGTLIADYLGTRYNPTSPIQLNTPYKATLINNVFALYNETTGQQLLTNTFTTQTRNQNKPILIFSGYDTIGPNLLATDYKISNLKLYDSTGAISHNYIPAKNSSNVIGMYDTVTDTFLTNAGTGDFTAGTVQSGIGFVECPANVICPGVTNATNNAAVAQGIASFNIPAGKYLPANTSYSLYTQLEYLESSGTQAINTGVAVRDIYKLDVAFTINEDAGNTGGAIFGGRDGANYGGILAAVGWNSSMLIDWGSRWTTGFTPTGHVPYKIIVEHKTAQIYNETTNARVASYTYSTKSSQNVPLYLFGLYSGGNVGYFSKRLQIRNVKIYTNANTLAHNYVPAKNASDVIGMYDTVTDTFLTNAGTGTFAAGPTVQGGIGFDQCLANSFCPGITNATNNAQSPQGITACSTLDNGAYPNSAAGATANTDCYGACTVANANIAHATAVSGNDYYGGTNNDTCIVTSCSDGWHAQPNPPDLYTHPGTAPAVAYAVTDGSGNNFNATDTEDKKYIVNASNYNLIGDNSAFVIDYGTEGLISGHGQCSQYDGVNVGATRSNLGGSGIYCWCKINSYTTAGGTHYDFTGDWVFRKNLTNASYCLANCANYCGRALMLEFGNVSAFHTALRDNAGFDPNDYLNPGTCVANPISITWLDADEADITANNADETVYGGEIRTPVRARHKPGQTFQYWRFIKE